MFTYFTNYFRVLILANGAYGLRMETMCKGKLLYYHGHGLFLRKHFWINTLSNLYTLFGTWGAARCTDLR